MISSKQEPSPLAYIYNTVLEVREDSDYEDFYVIDKVEVDSNFILVKEFIDYAETFIVNVASGQIILRDEP